MKKNTGVFYFFIILFTALLSINLVWRFTPVKAEIRDSLHEKLNPYLGGSFKMDDFSLGFGYISFHDISIGQKEKNYSLQIDEVQIGYSIHKLLIKKLDPLQVIESITFRNPRLILHTQKKGVHQQSGRDSLNITPFVAGFRKLNDIDRIFIRNGNILWERVPDSLTKIMTSLDGVLFINPDSAAKLNLTGSIFDAPNRGVNLSGKIDFRKQSWDITTELDESRLEHGLPFLNGPNFSVLDAYARGKLQLHCATPNLLDLNVRGSLVVRKMKSLLFNQELSTDDFRIEFAGQKMLLTPVSGTAGGGKFILTGNLGEVFHPGLYVSLDFDNYRAKNIAISAPILELLNQGKLQGHVEVNGPAGNLVVTGKLYSSRLQYAIAPFYRASLDFIFKDKIWTFKDLRAHAIGMDHRGTGEIDFNKMKMRLNLHSYKHFPENLFPIIDRLNDTRMDYYSTMSGDFETLTFTGKVNSFFVHGSDTLFHTIAFYKLVDDFIVVNADNTPRDKFRLHARASKLWDDPTFDILELKNLPIDSLSSNAAVRWLSQNFRADFFLSGPVNYPSAKLNLVSRQSEDLVFAFSGNAVNLLEPNLKFNGRFRFLFQPMEVSGRFLLKETANRVNLQLIAPDVAKGRLSIGLQNDSLFSGSFQLEKIALNRYMGRLPGLQRAVSEGFVWGEAQFSGTTNQPKIDFNFQGDQFIINENGYYSALLRGVYRKTGLVLDKAQINHNERPIFKAHFNLDMRNNQCEGRFQGGKIESNFLASTILNDSKLIRGDSRYDISIRGLFERPEIWGSVIMHDGVLFDQAFRNLNIVFQDSIPAGATLFQIKKHIFNILNFTYVDKKGYTVEAKGKFALDPGGANDLRINVKGNILSEIPLIIEYFHNPNCVGELSMHITGTRENPRLNAGRLIIYTGSLEFESVVPKLTDIRADVELREGEQFVRIHTLKGKLENRWVQIGNLPASAIKTVQLQPWDFHDIGLNFGVLTLETDPRGIPLSIPGLMNPGDLGYFATDGMRPGEKFYFAGPINLPHVRGKGTIYESRVTFPFLITEETDTLEESPVMDFLMNIDWDVQVIAGLGNRYFVDIPAVIGQVYLDLSLDEVSQGLHFTGRLIDESFRVEGEVESTRGRVEYLDVNFRVEKFGAVFNRFELYPEVYGRAWTTVRDSTNFPKDIYLVLYAVDPETKQEVSRGRWEDFRFKLVSSDPTIGETQENVLSYLGYSVDNLSRKAGNVGLTLTENYLIRPLVRPLERKLERGLKLDYVRLQSSITSNLFYYGFQNRFKFLENPNYYRNPLNNNFDPALLLLQSSEITLGKYVLRDIYFTYSGQLVSIYDESKLGLNHKFGLEYRLLRNTLLEFEYDKFQFNPDYYSRKALQDWRIRLRHSINF